MGKEQEPKGNLELEQKEAYERMVTSGLFFLGGAIASCHWPIAVAPTLVYAADFARNYKNYRRLTK
jgi:hypothetical protein